MAGETKAKKLMSRIIPIVTGVSQGSSVGYEVWKKLWLDALKRERNEKWDLGTAIECKVAPEKSPKFVSINGGFASGCQFVDLATNFGIGLPEGLKELGAEACKSRVDDTLGLLNKDNCMLVGSRSNAIYPVVSMFVPNSLLKDFVVGMVGKTLLEEPTDGCFSMENQIPAALKGQVSTFTLEGYNHLELASAYSSNKGKAIDGNRKLYDVRKDWLTKEA